MLFDMRTYNRLSVVNTRPFSTKHFKQLPKVRLTIQYVNVNNGVYLYAKIYKGAN